MKIINKIYKFYNHRLYHYLSEFRGFTRLAMIMRTLAERNLNKVQSRGDSVFDYEWDNLIILDSCRYDYYSDLYPDANYRISRESDTAGFLKENFSDKEQLDLVYISGCNFLSQRNFKNKVGKNPSNLFLEVYEVFNDHWNKEYGTVLPKHIVNEAKLAEEEYRGKPKIIHFMQPHWPYIKYQFEEEEKIRENDRKIRDDSKNKVNGLWYLDGCDYIDEDEIKEAYRCEIKNVREKAVKLADSLEGKTVITADHGELLGEDGVYGHREGSDVSKLRKVPWDVIND